MNNLQILDGQRSTGHRLLEYHIDRQRDIDGTTDEAKFREIAQSLGFVPDDFVPGSGEHAPIEHWTCRFPGSGPEFQKKFDELGKRLRAVLGVQGLWRGYVEGEKNVIWNITPNQSEFNAAVESPFHATLKKLPRGAFRQAEIHVTIPLQSADGKKLADERLCERMLAMGFYPVDWQDPHGAVERIFTMQTDSSNIIRTTLAPMTRFLKQSGGMTHATIELEDVLDSFQVQGDRGIVSDRSMPTISDEEIAVDTPPVISRLQFANGKIIESLLG